MTLTRILIAAGILGILVGGSSPLLAGSMTYSAGLGYDYFSQKYFLDSLVTSGADSVLTRFAYTSSYLNDFKGSLGATYRSADGRRVEARATYEQTAHLFRTKLYGDWRPKIGKGKLEWHAEGDWRRRFSGDLSEGQSYLLGSTMLRYKFPVGASTTLWSSAQSDGVHFSDSSAYAYDYYRVGGKIGIDQMLGNFNVIQADLFILGRTVPDSGSLSYVSGGFESFLFGTFGRCDLDLLTRLEVKDYRRADELDDYTRADLDGRMKVRLGRRFIGRSDFSGDFTWYAPGDHVNATYQRVSLTALAGYEWSMLTAAIGPAAELLHQRGSDVAEREDYYELGGRASLDLVAPGRAVGSIESTTGRRTVRYPSSYLTSFSFERVSLFADVTIIGGLSVNALGSAEWEWHPDSANNNALFLISSSLVFRF